MTTGASEAKRDRRDSSLGFRGKRDLLVEALRTAILRGDLPAGEHLRQDELAERFGVSSSPVREALRVLEAQGFLSYVPHRGVTVADMTGWFEQSYRLREALECLATRMAAERITPERAARLETLALAIEQAASAGDRAGRRRAHAAFHEALYETSGFRPLVELIQTTYAWFAYEEVTILPGHRSSNDHLEIARLVGAGDGEAAAARLSAHFQSVLSAFAAANDGRDVLSAAGDGSGGQRS